MDRLLAVQPADVVLVHQEPGAENLSEELLLRHPQLPVVVMVTDTSEEDGSRWVSAGVFGLVSLRRDGLERLATTLRPAAAGEILIPPATLPRMI